jgi:predicted type IV restriction endonuclease
MASKEEETMKKLTEFIKKVQSDERFAAYDEAAIKQAIILKILSLVDWDPFDADEVQPEYEAGGGKIDFSLRHSGTNKFFIMVKKGDKDFPKYQDKLLGYAVQGKAEMAILADGLTWWMFLPLLGGSAEEKRYHVLDMKEQPAEEVSEKIEMFLAKGNVTSGKALKVAEDIYETRQRNLLIRGHLPKAWQKIISEPEKWLTNLLADVTKELCGYKPEREVVEEFLAHEVQVKADLERMLRPEPSPPSPPPDEAPLLYPEKTPASVRSEDFTGKSIIAFSLDGKRHEVKSWKAMFLKLSDVVLPKNKKDELEVLFTLSTPQREYFSKNPYEFLSGEKISGTGIYVDTNLSAREVVELSHKMLMLFGRKESDLSIEVK